MIRTFLREIEKLELTEAQAAAGEFPITVIVPGFNKGKGRFYPAEVLKRDHKIFENAKMFSDHQTPAELKARPEGSLSNYVAQLKNVHWDEAAQKVRGTAKVFDPTFKEKLSNMQKQGLLSEMGVSIRAAGTGKENAIVEGSKTTAIESLIKSRSVDFVTYPGAGGQVEAIESDPGDVDDIEIISLESLKSLRPDLIEMIESGKEKQLMNEAEILKMQKDFAEAQASLVKVTADLASANAKIAESENKAKKAEAQTAIGKLVQEAKLPKASKDRLVKQYAEVTSVDGVAEAIKAEAEYVKSLTGGKVVNMGEADNGTSDVTTNAQVDDAFKLLKK